VQHERINQPRGPMQVVPMSFDDFAEYDEQNGNRQDLPDGGAVIHGACGIAYRSPDGACIAVIVAANN
jgi:hypothetical protein